MEASQPSFETCRKQCMSAFIQKRLEAFCYEDGIAGSLSHCFWFVSALSRQLCLLWSSALPLPLGWWPWEACGASTPAPRVGSTLWACCLGRPDCLLDVAAYFALV